MRRHVLGVGGQQVIAEEGVLRVSRDRFDEVFLVVRRVEGLEKVRTCTFRKCTLLTDPEKPMSPIAIRASSPLLAPSWGRNDST